MASQYKFPIPSSRLTEIRKNRMLYADYISKIQANNQGCDTARTGLEDGGVAPGSIVPDLLDGARNTTQTERDLILASTACPITSVVVVEPTYTVITDGLQLYYDVGNTASYPGSGTTIYDLSPNGYNGTLVNGPTYSSVNGGSLVFDGSNDYINTNNSLGYEAFTLMAWFKTSDATNFRMLISKETSLGVPWNYRMYLYQTSGDLIGDVAKVGSTDEATYARNLADGTWHMTAFSRNTSNDTLNLYIDGVLVNSHTDSLTAGSIINSQNVWIGRSAFSGGSYPWLGNIAAALIYNRALTDAEVLNNFRATKTRFGL